jgi:hypothetical protein
LQLVTDVSELPVACVFRVEIMEATLAYLRNIARRNGLWRNTVSQPGDREPRLHCDENLKSQIFWLCLLVDLTTLYQV